MEPVLRLVLAAVLIVAALAKARHPAGTAERLAPHGIASRLRGPLVWGLVAVETGLAVLIAVGFQTPFVAAIAAALFAVFAAAFMRLRLRGVRRADCGCFGVARERGTLVVAGRAGVLSVAAVYLALGAPFPSVGDTGPLWVAIAILAAAVVGLTVLVLALYRQVGVLSLRLGPRMALELEDEGPALGRAAPALRGLARTGPELVAFSSPSCRLCAELAPGLRALSREGLAVHEVMEDAHADVFARWGVPGTPYVVAVEDGIVAAKGLVNTLEQVDGVIATGKARRSAAA
jgi:uncharacterized membrane protein YphA (DoxX/SURF4 family)